MEKETFELPVFELKSNEILVYFGNSVGRIERANVYKKFGGQMGKVTGISGRCYFICVYHLNYRDNPSIEKIDKKFISQQVKNFYLYAYSNPQKKFLVTYETLDAIFSGYSIRDMASFFSKYAIPENVIFDKVFNGCII